MYKSGDPVIAYLGEDRQIYFNKPGKTICDFPARIVHHGDQKIIFITDTPETFDGGQVIPPPGYKAQGIKANK